jgi:hypothetical protein
VDFDGGGSADRLNLAVESVVIDEFGGYWS